jgi:hypothetical protein
MLSVANKPFMLRVIMLSVIMLSVIMLSIIMLSVIMLSVIMLSVVMPNVIAPLLHSHAVNESYYYAKCRYTECPEKNTLAYFDAATVTKKKKVF